MSSSDKLRRLHSRSKSADRLSEIEQPQPKKLKNDMDIKSTKELASTANVKVLEVLWRLSAHGVITPIIRFKKILLSHTNIEYVSGFNARFIVDNSIGPGAIITIIRSSEFIAHVISVVKPAEKPSLPGGQNYEWHGYHIVDKNLSLYWKDKIRFSYKLI